MRQSQRPSDRVPTGTNDCHLGFETNKKLNSPCACVIVCIMQRFTFISDPTQEFPNNTNQKFKVRLPLPLQLDGQWEASLWSLSVPDRELENKIVFQDTSQVILDFKFTIYRLGGWSSSDQKYTSLTTKAVNETLSVKDVMNESTPAQTGVEFWQNCIRMMDETVMRETLEVKTDYSVPVAVPRAWKPFFKWNGNDLTLEAVSKDNVVTSGGTPYSWFAMSTKLAEAFGFIQYSKLFKRYILADNASALYPLYDEKGTSISLGILTSVPGLKGPARAATLTPDVDTTDPKLSTAKFENNKIFFSRAVQWTFRRLNESFDKLHNGKDVVMVYTDLVQSTMVGNGRFPLLRKLSVDRKGSGRVTVEPYHREWVPLQTNWIEVVEFQLSTPGGALTHLLPGKTLITVGLQQRL